MAKPGRKPVDTDVVSVRIPNAVIDKIDRYRQSDPKIPSRPEVIRQALYEWLERNGVK